MSLGFLEGSWLESLSIENRGMEKVVRNEPQPLPLKLTVMLRQTVPPVAYRLGWIR